MSRVDKKWVVEEYLGLERLKTEVGIRKERLDKAIEKLADKLDGMTPSNQTRKFDVVHTGNTFRFSKVAKPLTIALPGVVEEVVLEMRNKGKKIKSTFLKMRSASVDTTALASAWGSLSPDVRKALRPYVKVKSYYDVGKINNAFLEGIITKEQLESMTQEDVSYYIKVSKFKQKGKKR